MGGYFDNAATSYPKPEEVYLVADAYLREAANPGRAAHARALGSARCLFEARVAIAGFLGVGRPERLIFTPGCTYSVNMALKGLPFGPGDVVLVTALEHNAVMRPLRQLTQSSGISVHSLPYSPGEIVSGEDLVQELDRHRPQLCVFTEASNVTGEMLDIRLLAGICRDRNVPVMVDAAQTAGYAESRLDELGISLWCASGHKALMGPPGVGLLYVAPDIRLGPLVAGGTGSRSEELDMPEAYPDHLESGTLPGPAVAGLNAGVSFITRTGLAKIREHELLLTLRLVSGLETIKGVRIVGQPRADRRAPTVSFQLAALAATRVADRLDQEYGIAVRSGLHCAALAHQTLGTTQSGVVRASLGWFNTEAEVDDICRAIETLSLGYDSSGSARG